MNIDIDTNKMGGKLVPVGIIALFLWLGLSGDGISGQGAVHDIMQYVVDKAHFGIKMLVGIALALLIVYVTNWVRAMPWFDRYGAATEMEIIRRRVTNGERVEGDGLAVAIQFAANTILIAVVIFGIILIQKL